VVLAHGFTQNRHCWGGLDSALAERATVLRVDLPGHGSSHSLRADVSKGAELLGTAGGVAHYVGYSMGGRHVMRLALDRPDLVQSAVLIGTNPGIEDTAERVARREADQARASRIEKIGVEAFLKEWLALPLFAGLNPHQANVPARLGNRAEGLAASLRLAGTGSQEPMWSRLPSLRAPVFFMAGERDAKYAAMGTRAAGLSPGGIRPVVIPGAGHAAHLERPEAVLRVVSSWLDEH